MKFYFEEPFIQDNFMYQIHQEGILDFNGKHSIGQKFLWCLKDHSFVLQNKRSSQ
jgi:hypothetical protein